MVICDHSDDVPGVDPFKKTHVPHHKKSDSQMNWEKPNAPTAPDTHESLKSLFNKKKVRCNTAWKRFSENGFYKRDVRFYDNLKDIVPTLEDEKKGLFSSFDPSGRFRPPIGKYFHCKDLNTEKQNVNEILAKTEMEESPLP